MFLSFSDFSFFVFVKYLETKKLTCCIRMFICIPLKLIRKRLDLAMSVDVLKILLFLPALYYVKLKYASFKISLLVFISLIMYYSSPLSLTT